MVFLGLMNIFLAILLQPLVIKEGDRCTATYVFYYCLCLSFTFVGGILCYLLFRKIALGR
ncbi:hypothetical protein SAMN04487852_103281 [Prevotella sp. tf2-5]|nr:hypothetical protein SAMN04487852_103281 [Prevotella sp. tf2-5]